MQVIVRIVLCHDLCIEVPRRYVRGYSRSLSHLQSEVSVWGKRHGCSGTLIRHCFFVTSYVNRWLSVIFGTMLELLHLVARPCIVVWMASCDCPKVEVIKMRFHLVALRL